MSEFALYTIESEFRDRHPDIAVTAVIGDVKSAPRMNEVLARFKPHVIFHAAAYKHVPLMEQDNAWQAVQNNVLGTLTVARAAREHGVEKFILISTDKAVNPTNVMGASKRCAESYCQAMAIADADEPHATRFVAVRFGNVLGSTGSVVPLFEQQLRAGGPLTVTHPDIERFFMTIREAVQLVLQASALGTTLPTMQGRVFVLDMGRPVRIADLARQMIRLAGKRPEIDVQIQFTGLRPGEKLFEELFHAGEKIEATGIPRISVASPRTPGLEVIRARLRELEAACEASNRQGVLEKLRALVPEFGPHDKVVITK